MVFRPKIASLTVLLAVALVAAGAAPVAAAQPTVRIPTSAADWASFTQGEKTATMKWVWAQKDRMIANGTWTWTEATGVDTSSAGTTRLASTLAVSGSVNCGIKTNAQAWGTYATGWANVSTTASVFSLDTGLHGMENKFWHNSTLFSHGWGAGGGGTYEYAESSQDFKFPWDTVTWQVQSWGTAQTSLNVFIFKNKYCGKTVAG